MSGIDGAASERLEASPSGGEGAVAARERDVSSPRVLMVTARFLPHIGGTEIHTYELARRLQARGVDVTALTTERDSRQVHSDSRYGFPVIRVRAWPRRRDWYIAPGIARVIARGGWDLVHIQGVHTMVLPVAIAAARSAQLPYIVTLHSGGHSSATRRRFRLLVWRVLARWIRAADWIIAVSEFERDIFSTLLTLPPDKMSVIPSGVEIPDPARPRARRKAGEGPLLVSVGRLEAYKGHDRVIRALPGVAARYPGARLVILGSGPSERHLRRLAVDRGVKERVQIVRVPAERRAELNRVFDGADLVLALSAYESQGLAAMEAIAHGCSVLVADRTALRELVTAGLATGVSLGTTEELTSTIIRNLDQPHRPSGELPTWEGCAEKTHELYLSLLSRRKKGRGGYRVRSPGRGH